MLTGGERTGPWGGVGGGRVRPMAGFAQPVSGKVVKRPFIVRKQGLFLSWKRKQKRKKPSQISHLPFYVQRHACWPASQPLAPPPDWEGPLSSQHKKEFSLGGQ